jgi:pimeloyl-ACP methyl ester carboxylesterase
MLPVMTFPSSPATPASHPLSDRTARARGLARVLGGVERVAPALAARLAEGLFVKTMRPAPRPPEAAWLRQARRDTLRVMGRRITTYRSGPAGAPRVVCTHGWWSHAGRFAPLGTALAAAGFEVLAFDAPGHGRSGGWRASMPEFARTLRAVVESTGPVHAAIGHSLGGAATLYAMARGLPAERAVVLAAPADVMIWVDRYAAMMGLSPALDAAMRARLGARLDVAWDDLDLARHAAALAVPGLVLHDQDDGDVPIGEGQAIAAAWPEARFVGTQGLGHRAILRDPEVIAQVVAFLRDDSVAEQVL